VLEGYWVETEVRPADIDPLVPRTGLYFFYGTLSDPSLLAEILSLDEAPALQPSKIVGYSLKLWSQYPALVDGHTGEEIQGIAWEAAGQSPGRL
jgi:Gamma-glutamyl cyclotransferase, AIG2-like